MRMKHIYQISNESSPGTKEPWYEVYLTEKSRIPIAHLSTKEELDTYTKDCGAYQYHPYCPEVRLSGEFIVHNDTDGFPASPDIFKSKADAEAWIERFRASFKRSANVRAGFPDGFYKTSECIRIHPKDINLRIEELEEDL